MDHTTDEHTQARRLAQAVVAAHDDRACDFCRDALPDYATAQLAGEDAARLWPAIAAHMDGCVTCSEDYAILYAAHEREATLPDVAPPRWNLDFLGERAASTPSRNAVERAVDALRGAVTAAGSRIRIVVGDALLAVSPLPAPTMALRGGSGTRLIDLRFAQPAAAVAEVRVMAYAMPGAPERASVVVGCDVVDRGWPDLEGIVVVLRADDTEFQTITNPFGEATFEGVPTAALAGLQIELDMGAPTTT